MSTNHILRWTWDDGRVRAEAVCNAAPDADCRLTSVDCDCERWGEIHHRNDGTIWHLVEADYASEPDQWHEVKPADYCNVCMFINESDCAEELNDRMVASFVLAETPIKPVWDNDGCLWVPA